MKIDQCKSCGGEVIWIVDQNSARLLVNKTRVRGYLPIGGDEWAYIADRAKTDGSPQLVYISHFLTCPNATAHSKGKSVNIETPDAKSFDPGGYR